MEKSINAVDMISVLKVLNANKLFSENMIYSYCGNKVFRYDIENGSFTTMVNRVKNLDMQEISRDKYITWKTIGHLKKEDGHLQVTIQTGKKTNVKVAVHRIAAMYMLGISSLNGTFGKGSEYVVDHINEDKLDNRASNLQVLSRGDNTRKYHARKG